MKSSVFILSSYLLNFAFFGELLRNCQYGAIHDDNEDGCEWERGQFNDLLIKRSLLMFFRSPVEALEALSQQSYSTERVESVERAVFHLSLMRLLSKISLPVSLFVGGHYSCT